VLVYSIIGRPYLTMLTRRYICTRCDHVFDVASSDKFVKGKLPYCPQCGAEDAKLEVLDTADTKDKESSKTSVLDK